MHSMTQDDTPLVIGGVDAHADAHHLAALDERGGLLASKSFPTTTLGYAQALDWLSGYGQIDAIAVESTGSYAAAFVRYLREHEIRVFEVNQPHARTRRRRGKSDPIDAETAARLLLAGKATAIPKQTNGIVDDPAASRHAQQRGQGTLGRARAGPRSAHHRTAATSRPARRPQDAPRQSRDRARLRVSARDLTRPLDAAKFALRALAQRINTLDDEIALLDHHLEELVAVAAPRTLQLLGISTGHAGQLLVTAGQNIERFNGESSFAAICGASPVPASSGKTNRHRLNPGGDRQANRPLHPIVVVRLRYCQRTRDYVERRTREGKTQREIMRCPKRYVAREIYTVLRADLEDLDNRPRQRMTAILSANPGRGTTRKRT